MDHVRECLMKALEQLGIQSAMISDMDMTTGELGLNSIELVQLAVVLFDEFGVKLKLQKSENLSLNELCTKVAKVCELQGKAVNQ